MLIFNGLAKGLIGTVVALSLMGGAKAEDATYASVDDALRKGVTAYENGAYEVALPALEFAQADNNILARYYLARIYADDGGPVTNRAKAYGLYRDIADELTDADPDDDDRAPYVGKALTALARYLMTGLPEAGVAPDPSLAAKYFRHAAMFFRDKDAQFELAKLEIETADPDRDLANAKHWLAILSQEGHAGAMAYLAKLYWAGDVMKRDAPRALALATVAVANAPFEEQVWIEDTHQEIFCAASSDTRDGAKTLLALWGGFYDRQPAKTGRFLQLSTPLDTASARTCAGGERVVPLTRDTPKALPGQERLSSEKLVPELTPSPPSSDMRTVGTSEPEDKPSAN